MVRNSELPEVGHTAKMVADYVQSLLKEKEITQEETGNIIGRAQSYASLRIKGLKPWSVDELDALAPHIGYGNALDLMNAVHKQKFEDDTYRAMHVSDLGLAAKHGDTDGEQEAYEVEP